MDGGVPYDEASGMAVSGHEALDQLVATLGTIIGASAAAEATPANRVSVATWLTNFARSTQKHAQLRPSPGGSAEAVAQPPKGDGGTSGSD